MVVKPIINFATKYTDDILGLSIRKWTKPTSFENLRFAPRNTGDVFNTSSAQDYLSADFIKNLLNIKGKTQIETAAKIKDEILTAMKYKNPSALQIIENPLARGTGAFCPTTGKITFSQIPESKEELIAMLYHELDHMDKIVKIYKAKGAEAFETLLKTNLNKSKLRKFKWNNDFYATMSKDISIDNFNVNRYARALSKYRNFNLDELYGQFLYFHNPLEKDAYAIQKKVLIALGKDGFIPPDSFPKGYLNAGKVLYKNPGKMNPENCDIEDYLEGLYKLARLKCVEQTPEVKKLQSLIAQTLKNGYNTGKGGLSDTEKEWLIETYNKTISNKELKEMGQKPNELVESWLKKAFC